MSLNNDWIFKVDGLDRLAFDWAYTARRTAASLIPTVLARLKAAAPVSPVKADAGRFRDSIGFRFESGPDVMRLLFVSTAPYGRWVIEPTQQGAVLQPTQTQAMRFPSGVGDYVFAKSIIRGATPGNDFNKRVAEEMTPYIMSVFSESIVLVQT